MRVPDRQIAVRLRPRPKGGGISLGQAKGGPRVGLPSRSTQGTVRLSATGNFAENPATCREGEFDVCLVARAGAQSWHPVAQSMHWASCCWSCPLRWPGIPPAGSQTDHSRSRSRAAAADRLGCGSNPNSSGSSKAKTSERASQLRACRSCSSLGVLMRNNYAI